MTNKPDVAICQEARAAAAKQVALARTRRRAKRRRGRENLAERLKRLQAEVAVHRDRASRAQANLGPAIRVAVATTQQEPGTKAWNDVRIAAVDAAARPTRFILEAQKPEDLCAAGELIARTLGLSPAPELMSLRLLLPRLAKKKRELARFLLLELPAHRRTTRTLRSRIADALRRTGKFVSVRAEGLRLGTYSGGTEQGFEMDVPDDVDWYLSSPETGGVDFRGHRDAIDVYGAWDLLGIGPEDDSSQAGQGVIIGHPDTGFRPHADYPVGQIDLANAYNAFADSTTDPSQDPVNENVARHPLTPRGFPYFVMHGTFTASVIVAPREGEADEIVGVAPGATILPLRCMNTVILAGDVEIVAAVEQAIDQNVDVLSISLGGAPHPCLREALKVAVEGGIIVVAAAGQSQGFPAPQAVAAPAAYPEVIAVGGAIGPVPWEAAFHGPEVDVCAPAVQIKHASFETDGDDTDGRSSGTSFATAITAGLAALWLQRHGGRQAIEAGVPGVPVQQVFRHLLRETAVDTTIFADDPPPGGWDTANFGVGLVNARALLNRDLPLPGDVPPIDPAPPFNVYASASGIAIVDVNEPWSLAALSGLFTAVASIAGFAGSAAEAVGDLWAEFWEDPLGNSERTVTGWIRAAGDVAGTVAAGIRSDAAAAAWENALAAAASVGGELGVFLTDLSNQAEETWNEAEDAADKAVEQGEDAIEEFIEETGNFIEETSESASETAGDVVEGIVGAIGGLFG